MTRDGWTDYGSVWSSGEIAAVRLLLGDTSSVTETYAAWAPSLWGITGAGDDARDGFYWTRAWFERLTGTQLPSGWPPIDPDDGWGGILTDLQRDLGHIDPNLVVLQVKQKAGILEVWVEASEPELAGAVNARIAAAEELSARTCERCGQPGRIRQRVDGWYQALCDEHMSQDRAAALSEAPPPPETVGELRALLRGVPDSTLLLTDGYEGGLTTILAATLIEVQRLDRGDSDWLGDYDTVENAKRAVESPLPMHDAASYVDDPVMALVLTREGR